MRIFLLFFSILFFQTGIAQNDCVCCTEHYLDFDFWIGNWEVVDKQGNMLGTNSIIKAQDNCVLIENWKSAKANYTGTSYNFYDAIQNKWNQVWVDNNGGSLKLSGNRDKSQMILKSETSKNKDGIPYFHQVTWTVNKNGTVRQLWETITNVKSAIVFDGLYKKVN